MLIKGATGLWVGSGTEHNLAWGQVKVSRKLIYFIGVAYMSPDILILLYLLWPLLLRKLTRDDLNAHWEPMGI